MDAEKFGAFIQSCRKELGLTQAELAEQLHVTDKAISRWERGVGFPDIKLLEPLAEALGVTLIELMQSRKIEEDLTKDTASALAAETVNLMQEQQKLSVRRRVILVIGSILISAAELFLLYLALFAQLQPRWTRYVLYAIGILGGSIGAQSLRYIVTKQYLQSTPKTVWSTWQMQVLTAVAVAGALLFLLSWRFNRGDPTWQIVAMLAGLAMLLPAVLYYANHEFDFDDE